MVWSVLNSPFLARKHRFLLRRLGGRQINHQIEIQLLNMIYFGHLLLYSKEKIWNILALKFKYYYVSL